MSLAKKLVPAAAFLAVILVPALALAEDKVASAEGEYKMGAYLGAGLAVGFGALGGALGQGRAAASALEGIARNPGAAAKIQGPMLIALALIESLVLVAFGMGFLLQLK